MRLFCSNQRNDIFSQFFFTLSNWNQFGSFASSVSFILLVLPLSFWFSRVFVLFGCTTTMTMTTCVWSTAQQITDIFLVPFTSQRRALCGGGVCLAWYILNLCEINCLKQKKRAYYSMVRYSYVFCCCCCCFGSWRMRHLHRAHELLWIDGVVVMVNAYSATKKLECLLNIVAPQVRMNAGPSECVYVCAWMRACV